MRYKSQQVFMWAAIAIGMAISLISCSKQIGTEPQAQAGNGSGVDDQAALPHTKKYSSDVANVWYLTLSDIVKTKPYFSSQAIRIYAYSGLALYESVAPGMPSKGSILEGLTGTSVSYEKKKDYYWPAAANAAIARIAGKIMQTYATPNLTRVKAVEDSFKLVFSGLAPQESLQRSVEFGEKIADAIFEWSMKDGTFNSNGTPTICPPYLLSNTPGSWQPTPPGFFPAAGACQGDLRTFLGLGPSESIVWSEVAFSTEPGSPFYQAAEEVYAKNMSISTDTKRMFENWRDINTYYQPLSHMVRIAAFIFQKEKLNLEDAALLYLKMTIASHDAVNAAFREKYRYALLRPVTYIRSVLNQPGWLSLPVTPQTPSFPDEMAPTAASVEVLESYFGKNYAFIDSTNKALLGQWEYHSFEEMLQDIVDARVSAGTNFRFCLDAGIVEGRTIGEMVNGMPFRKTF